MKPSNEPEPPHLADESRWYNEHAALFVTTLKWALLGALAGVCVGWGTRAFLWSLTASSRLVDRAFPGGFRPYFLLPLALPVCVWLIRTFAPTAKGHGTEAVISVVFKQLMQAGALGYCQADSCRVGGVNEVLAILLLAAKFELPVCPHAGGVGLCEYVQHLAIYDYIALNPSIEMKAGSLNDHEFPSGSVWRIP